MSNKKELEGLLPKKPIEWRPQKWRLGILIFIIVVGVLLRGIIGDILVTAGIISLIIKFINYKKGKSRKAFNK